MPEACPATWAPVWAAMHGPKLVPSAPYEPPHHAPVGAAWAKAIAGMTNATTANTATTAVHFMSTLRLLEFTAFDFVLSGPLDPCSVVLARAAAKTATRVPSHDGRANVAMMGT